MSDPITESDDIEESDAIVAESPTFAPLEEIAPESVTGKISPMVLGWVVFATLVGAVVFGGLWHGVAYYFFEIPFIIAILAGMGAGYLVGYALKPARLKKASIAAWLGLAAALLTVFSRHTWDAYSDRPAMVSYLEKHARLRYPDMSPSEAHARSEAVLTPLDTMRWHMEASAENGLVFQGTRRGAPIGRGVRLRGAWFWGLLALNTIAASIAGAATAEITGMKRYCAECGKPLKENLLFRRHSDQAGEVLDHARKQDWYGLMSLPKAERTDLKNMTEVLLHRCEEGGCPATVSVETQTATEPRKKVLHAWIDPESANAARAASIAEPI